MLAWSDTMQISHFTFCSWRCPCGKGGPIRYPAPEISVVPMIPKNTNIFETAEAIREVDRALNALAYEGE